MKTPPVVPKSQSETDEQQLDKALTNRAFFLGIASLTQAIESEGLLNRGEITSDTLGELLSARDSSFRWLCREYLRSLRADAKTEMLRKFNSCLS